MAGILLFGDECTIVRELRCGGNRRNHEDPLFRIQFFNRDEVESDVMEEEVMERNVQLSLLELIE